MIREYDQFSLIIEVSLLKRSVNAVEPLCLMTVSPVFPFQTVIGSGY